jgi:hypothetical protein
LDLSGIPDPGTVATVDLLAAWDRMHTVSAYQRCLNCQVGKDNIPLWGTRDAPDRIHGMNINAGLSRIGAEGLSCGSCHQTRSGISSQNRRPDR